MYTTDSSQWSRAITALGFSACKPTQLEEAFATLESNVANIKGQLLTFPNNNTAEKRSADNLAANITDAFDALERPNPLPRDLMALRDLLTQADRLIAFSRSRNNL